MLQKPDELGQSEMEEGQMVADHQQKLIVVGAHPDDPETACGGTMALAVQAGYEVVSAYLTRGEAGISGATHEEASAIRMREALVACEILSARAEFLTRSTGRVRSRRPDMARYWPSWNASSRISCSLIGRSTRIGTTASARTWSMMRGSAWGESLLCTTSR